MSRHAFCITPNNVELHTSSDVSESSYGACVYIRSQENDYDLLQPRAKLPQYAQLLCLG